MELTLKQKWDLLVSENPKIRIKNAAEALGVSEEELLITDLGNGVTALNNNFSEILLEVEKLGKVMALTRNNECVHERKGIYLNGDFSSPHAQLFVGEDIDMRIFLSAWDSSFAVENGKLKSLQFFGKDGAAIHKIYLTDKSNVDAYEKLVAKFKAETVNLNLQEIAPLAPELPDDEIDQENFKKDWENLKDTHNFFGLLRKYKVSRTQALRLAPSEFFAKKIDNQKVAILIEKAAAADFEIMVFVGNKGNIQIHTGPVNRVLWQGPWINIMDPDFNLHLDTSKIAETWIVRKPTEDGVVTALEVFNDKGEIIVQFFGKRKPGIPELEEWRDLVKSLEN